MILSPLIRSPRIPPNFDELININKKNWQSMSASLKIFKELVNSSTLRHLPSATNTIHLK